MSLQAHNAPGVLRANQRRSPAAARNSRLDSKAASERQRRMMIPAATPPAVWLDVVSTSVRVSKPAKLSAVGSQLARSPTNAVRGLLPEQRSANADPSKPMLATMTHGRQLI
jgi:hypothetical protein